MNSYLIKITFIGFVVKFKKRKIIEVNVNNT